MPCECRTLRRGRRNVPAAIDFENRHWDVEPLKGVEQPSFLPRGVIDAAQRDKEMIWMECTNRILEGCQRRLVPDLTARLGFGRQSLDMAEDNTEALVRLVACAVRVRREPPKPADEDRRDHEDLRRALDERADERRKLSVVGCGLSSRNQEARLWSRRHAGIMPPAVTKAVTSLSPWQARVGGRPVC
jgi:hypothetical protein